MKTFPISAQLQPLLEQMSRDMAVPVEGLVNQAIFNWAKLHGYLEAGRTAPEVPARALPPPALAPAPEAEPETKRVVPVVEDPESGWKVAPLTERTAPRIPKQPRRVVLVLADREVAVDGERFLIGRDVSCDLTIDVPRISRQHAVILSGADQVVLEDLGSSNGTWFEGERIERKVLAHGDELRFGDTVVRVEFR